VAVAANVWGTGSTSAESDGGAALLTSADLSVAGVVSRTELSAVVTLLST